MNLPCVRTIVKNRDNHAESAMIAKPGKNERGVSPQVPVFVCQPGLQLGEHTRVLSRDDCFSHLELLSEHGGGLELPDQLGNRGWLLASTRTGRGKEQNEWHAKGSDYCFPPDLVHTFFSVVL
jgi:hypothetical protein